MIQREHEQLVRYSPIASLQLTVITWQIFRWGEASLGFTYRLFFMGSCHTRSDVNTVERKPRPPGLRLYGMEK